MRAGRGLAAAGLATASALVSEARLGRARRPLTGRWQEVPVEPRRRTLLGVSFRPRQAEAFGLSPRDVLGRLLGYPFEVVRLAAYWDRIEGRPGHFDPSELDWQVKAAARAGKSIVICTGAVKAFGYPEFFAPAHRVGKPLQERSLVEPTAYPELFSGAVCFVQQVVKRYRDCPAIVAWQVEHEALDPLGLEHSWRLAGTFVAAEVEAVRQADPDRPVVMNGFLPTSWPVAASQRWRTRGQGDSLSWALRLADIVGIDFYPRHALFGAGPWAVYLDGSNLPWHQAWRRRLASWAATPPRSPLARGRQVMVTEGQAEPWETATVPPSPIGAAMASCPPERVAENYNQAMRWQAHPRHPLALWAYLFWGAEYWLARRAQGDPTYLAAFERVLSSS
jgi:hypothetical protein